MGICTLKRSAEFQRVRGGLRAANSSFVIETRARPAAVDAAGIGDRGTGDCGPRFGFTVTRKIGNAVVRNRIRRRFREALRQLAPGIAIAGHDYVLVARTGVIGQRFDELSRLLAMTISGLHRQAASHRDRDRKLRDAPTRQSAADSPDPSKSRAKSGFESQTVASAKSPPKSSQKLSPKSAPKSAPKSGQS